MGKKHAYLLSTHPQKPNPQKNLNDLIKWKTDKGYKVISTALLDRPQNYLIQKHSFVLNMSCNNLKYTQHTQVLTKTIFLILIGTSNSLFDIFSVCFKITTARATQSSIPSLREFF